MKTLMTALKEKQERLIEECKAKAKYHRAEARKYRNDPNTAGYHMLQAKTYAESAKYWKNHLPTSV